MEGQGERWSKPHVSTVSLQALLDLKQELRTGCVLLESEDTTMAQIIGRDQHIIQIYYIIYVMYTYPIHIRSRVSVSR